LFNWYVLGRFKDTVSHFFGRLDTWIRGSGDSNENAVIRFQAFVYDCESMAAVPLTRKRHVEIFRLQLEQAGQ